MKKHTQFYYRKAHRYLGLLLGIQFMFWTLGGLYFSWSDMDHIHGDYQKKPAVLFAPGLQLVSPSQVLDRMHQEKKVDSIISLQLVQIAEKPVYQIVYAAGSHASGHSHRQQVQLADANTGKLLPPLTKQEAVAQARSRYKGMADVGQVEYITELSNHHEYRDNPLPAYAITFKDAYQTRVYVAAELGTVQKFRNTQWRIFDFMWMLHTMDYQSRDNFGNILLRVFSVFGLLTVFSGIILFVYSSPTIRRFTRKRALPSQHISKEHSI